jgi:ribosomal protein S18 acetylase RimI-like enzyme
MRYREATVHDIEAIARLHADSWRRNYRGAYLDDFLDGDVLSDRMNVWSELLEQPEPDQVTIVADRDGVVEGFVHATVQGDPRWGAFLHNLHVAHEMRGQGIGRRLMSETARTLISRRPGVGLYLWVLEQNEPAQAFYDARGGACVERAVRPMRGGGHAPTLRYAWPDPSVLLDIG